MRNLSNNASIFNVIIYYVLLKRVTFCSKEKNIHLLTWKNLSHKEKDIAQKYYQKNVFPVLTPLSVDPGHPFPFISNLSINLAIYLEHKDPTEASEFARIKIPPHDILPRLIRVEKIVEHYSDDAQQEQTVQHVLRT